MGVDYALIAEHSDKSCSYLTLNRGGRAEGFLLSYFSALEPAHYDVHDTAKEYPSYEITRDGWNSFMQLLGEKQDVIEYLAGYVKSVFDFDAFVPEELIPLDGLDEKQLAAYRLWLFDTFPQEREREVKPEDMQENLITTAYMLHVWMTFDETVRSCLDEDGCKVWISIG